MFDKLINMFKKPEIRNEAPDLGWANITQGRALELWGEDDYENSYPYIRFLANRFMKIKPFAIDANGKPLAKTPNALNCLARPNQDMSGVDFRDALVVLTSVFDDVFVLVWERKGGKIVPATETIREENIAGYTFLENAYIDDTNERVYRVISKGKINTYTTSQVIHLKNINPRNLSKGYSVVRATRRWTTVEDYLADYERSFFLNGAVPAGMFIITAPTYQEYKDIVTQMKKKHKGADNQHGVLYSYSPIDPTSNKPTQANITWVSFNVQNKDLGLNDLFSQADSKVQKAWGIHPYLIGDSKSAPNRSVAQSIERLAVENVVEPFTMKLWSRFQHELNRITGGLGYGINYEIETPNISDDEESEARANVLRVNAITTLTAFGYTLDSSIEALGLENNWKLLKKGVSTPKIENDKPEVDEGGEVEKTPKAHKHIEHGHFGHICHEGCDHAELMPAKGLIGEEQYQRQIEEVAEATMKRQIEQAIAEDIDMASIEDLFVSEMMTVIATILLTEGEAQWQQGLLLLMSHNIEVPTSAYSLSNDALKRYQEYLKTVFKTYSANTSESIKAVLTYAKSNNYTRHQTEKALMEILNTDRWRITRIGVTETNRSMRQGSVDAMIELHEEAHVAIEKAMKTTGHNICPFCEANELQWMPVQDVMLKQGEAIADTEGNLMVNNIADNWGTGWHPNCKCTTVYRINGAIADD